MLHKLIELIWKILFYDEEKMVLDCSVQKCQNSNIFHEFLNSMVFPCMEFFSTFFHVFQSLWEPCFNQNLNKQPKGQRSLTWVQCAKVNLPENIMQPFPHPNDATHKIWSRLANWLQRYSSSKVWNFRQSRTSNSKMSGLIWPKIELDQAFMPVLVFQQLWWWFYQKWTS